MRALLLCCALAAGCSGGPPTVWVELAEVPASVDRLVVRSVHLGRLQKETLTFENAKGFGAAPSFGLQLGQRTGHLAIGVEAWEKGCVVAYRELETNLTGSPLPLERLPLAMLPMPECKADYRRTPGMVAVAPATFTMGCDLARDPGCTDGDDPAHQVTLTKGYEIDRYEVTAIDYMACVDEGKCPPPTTAYLTVGRNPAYNLTWDHASAYCAARGKRLPSEAEWELAARGTDGRSYPWGNDEPSCSRANFVDCSASEISAPVGGRPSGASPFFAQDMAGNAVEWVEDWYADYPTARVTDPVGPASGTLKIGRGGSYFGTVDTIRSTFRLRRSPRGTITFADGTMQDEETWTGTFGVRCARTL
jgi:formylglycine-generating enzyme required for sulfatase activity